MDVDKSLDEIIASKKPQKTQKSQPAQRSTGPRHSSGNQTRSTPYTRPPGLGPDADKWTHDAYRGPGATRGARRPQVSAPAAATLNTTITGTGAAFLKESTRIEIVGLHYEVTPQDLKTIFSQTGTIMEGPQIKYDRSGRSTGIAWIQYASVQQAKAAINQFDGALTKGETISIRFAPIPVPPRQAPVSRDSFGHWTKRGSAARPAQTGGDLLSRLAPAKGDKGGNTTSHTNPRGGRGGRGKGRGRSGGRPKPKNEGDLDNELDSFMKKDGAGDVEMS
ncbi:hypothetical protein L204_104826 [Cryptococcus depauperatus]